MSKAVLRAEGLCKRFGRLQIVDDLSLEVKPGEVIGLLGPNGSGKTTSLRMMLGLIPPDSGRVTLLGHPPQRFQDQIGYLPEERGLYPDERAMGRLRGMSCAEAQRVCPKIVGSPSRCGPTAHSWPTWVGEGIALAHPADKMGTHPDAPWPDVVISLMVLGACLMATIKAGSVAASRVLIPGMPVLSISRPRRRR